MGTPHNGGMFCGPCYTCKCEMWLPKELYDAAMRGRGQISFYCAYGHGQIFSKGESDLDVMRRERDLARQQVAQRDDKIKDLTRSRQRALDEVDVMRTNAAKAKKRTAAGICPVCHRTFRQMALHMKHKHADFTAEELGKL